MKVALCHDWLTGMRGGERVLELLCDRFPDAPIYTLIHNRDAVSDRINAHPIHCSPLQKIPGIFQSYRNYLPLMPLLTRSWQVPDEVDLVISTSHCVAKSIRSPAATKHLCYCFTPMRYAWLFHEDYFPQPLKRSLLKPVLALLRSWDRRVSDRVDRFVGISQHVQKRIQDFYARDSELVYPPADTSYFTPTDEAREDYDFLISALVPYKKVDLAIRAYNQSGRPLKIMGSGSALDSYKAMAKPNIEFLGRQPDEQLREHYRRCRFLLFPGEEDYGIVPVEAMACGCPVIAYRKGGATETVAEALSGVFFDQQDETSLLEAVERAAQQDWDPLRIREHALRFSEQAFLDGIETQIAELIGS